MQPALAQVSDLNTLMQTSLSGDDLAQANLLLQMASAWARSYAQRAWPTIGDIPVSKVDTVVGIILTAVRRELINPRRATDETQGPESATYNIAACPPGFFTAEEIDFLQRCSPAGKNWWVQGTYRDDPRETIGYLYATGIAQPIPMYAPNDTAGYQNAFFW